MVVYVVIKQGRSGNYIGVDSIYLDENDALSRAAEIDAYFYLSATVETHVVTGHDPSEGKEHYYDWDNYDRTNTMG